MGTDYRNLLYLLSQNNKANQDTAKSDKSRLPKGREKKVLYILPIILIISVTLTKLGGKTGESEDGNIAQGEEYTYVCG